MKLLKGCLTAGLYPNVGRYSPLDGRIVVENETVAQFHFTSTLLHVEDPCSCAASSSSPSPSCPRSSPSPSSSPSLSSCSNVKTSSFCFVFHFFSFFFTFWYFLMANPWKNLSDPPRPGRHLHLLTKQVKMNNNKKANTIDNIKVSSIHFELNLKTSRKKTEKENPQESSINPKMDVSNLKRKSLQKSAKISKNQRKSAKIQTKLWSECEEWRKEEPWKRWVGNPPHSNVFFVFLCGSSPFNSTTSAEYL